MQFAFFYFSLVKNGQPLRSGRFVHDNSLNETGNGRLLFVLSSQSIQQNYRA